MMDRIRLEPLFDIRTVLAPDEDVLTIGIGPDGELCVCCVRGRDAWSAVGAKATFRLLTFYDGVCGGEVVIETEWAGCHEVQRMPGGDVLMVGGARTCGATPNAAIFATDGSFVRSLLLGDAVECVHVTRRGQIWVGHFDEGCGNSHNPGHGIVAFGEHGNVDFEHPTLECYCLNVENDVNRWFCDYPGDRLFLVSNGQYVGFWSDLPVRAKNILVDRNTVLLEGSRRSDEGWLLLELRSNGTWRQLRRIKFVDENEEDLAPVFRRTRRESVYFMNSRDVVYRGMVEMALI
ncbi:MAG: hypothetical protein KDC95_18330 [Planctomycetes bacterium]|nr:hypothetical protein [Planctomycetota bacterium]